jgi:hypothetical protein
VGHNRFYPHAKHLHAKVSTMTLAISVIYANMLYIALLERPGMNKAGQAGSLGSVLCAIINGQNSISLTLFHPAEMRAKPCFLSVHFLPVSKEMCDFLTFILPPIG